MKKYLIGGILLLFISGYIYKQKTSKLYVIDMSYNVKDITHLKDEYKKLNKEDGDTVEFLVHQEPLDDLSEADREYIKQQVAAKYPQATFPSDQVFALMKYGYSRYMLGQIADIFSILVPGTEHELLIAIAPGNFYHENSDKQEHIMVFKDESVRIDVDGLP